MSKRIFRVAGVVTTSRGATSVDGLKENEVLDFEAKNEDEAREMWRKTVSQDSTNMNWEVSGVTDVTDEVANES